MSRLIFKKFADDREREVLLRVLELNPELTVPVLGFENHGFYMEEYNQLTPEQNMNPEIIIQKIKLVRELHKIDVYHNDLGDFNFLIKDGIVKIIDFGSSFLMIDDEWLECLYENIYKNDGEIIKSKREAIYFELSSFIDSFKI